MNRHFSFLTLICLFLLSTTQWVNASHLPEWEAGLGLAEVYFPDYRGSAQYRSYTLPFPFMVYRGEKLTLDRRGLRGILFETKRVYLDISLAASVPVNSSDNDKRRGMPDLDTAFQIGPSLQVNLVGNERTSKYINLAVPVRKVISTDFNRFEGEGYLAHPHLNFNYAGFHPQGYWNAGLSLGALYADKQYHDYYFTVKDAFATPDRPAYASRSGYSGNRLTLTLTGRYTDYWMGTFLIYDHIANATFADSPLIERSYSFVTGLSFVWVFGQSEKHVQIHL